MKSIFLKVGVLCLFVISCETFSNGKTEQSATVSNTITNQILKPFEKKDLFVPKNTQILDSTLYLNKSFQNFKSSIGILNGLDPNDLGIYLTGAIGATNKLIAVNLPGNFEVPAVKSRIRVVKTQLLRCNYFSKEEDVDLLIIAMDDLFNSYNILMKRIDDVALSEDVLSENEFEVGQQDSGNLLPFKKN